MKRQIWAGLGIGLVGLGFVGVIVPGMPTTVFLILALFCFRRGSERFENWLLNHPMFGPTLRDWDKYKGMRARSKLVSVVMIWVFITASMLVLLKKPTVLVIVAVSGVLGTWYILTRPTIRDDESPSEQIAVNNEDQAFLG